MKMNLVKLLILFIFIAKYAYSNTLSDDVFVIENVKVFVDSGNLIDSKTIAMEEAANKAFEELLTRILPSKSNMSNLPKEHFVDLVERFDVVSQRLTSHSYRAQLAVVFNKNAIKSLLDSAGIRYASYYSKPILIIPILARDGHYTIWQQNPWYSTWHDLVQQKIKLLNFYLISGSLFEIEIINPRTIMADQYKELLPLLKQYNAEDLVIVFAEIKENQIEVSIRLLSNRYDQTRFERYKINSQESDGALFHRIDSDILTKLDNQYKGIESFGKPLMYTSNVEIKIDNPKHWTKIRNIMKNIKQIKDFRLTKEKLNIVELNLEYDVAPPVLSALLLKQGLLVVNNAGRMFLELANKN